MCEDNYNAWVTDLSQESTHVSSTTLIKSMRHNKIAVVVGAEVLGASNEVLQVADLRTCLPLCGFSDSLDLNVVTALVFQALHHMHPNDIIGIP